jgi:hypothetical protein
MELNPGIRNCQMRQLNLVNLPKPSSSAMGLDFTKPLTEMSIRNLPGDKARPVPKADVTAIFKPIEEWRLLECYAA